MRDIAATLRAGESITEEDLQKREDARERRRVRARRNVKAEEHPPQPIPKSMTLDERLKLPRHPAKWRVTSIMKIRQRVVLSAQYKGGKTTFVVNLVRALVDGVDFLDAYEVSQANLVTVLDFEMAEDDHNQLDEWYHRLGLPQTSFVVPAPGAVECRYRPEVAVVAKA